MLARPRLRFAVLAMAFIAAVPLEASGALKFSLSPLFETGFGQQGEYVYKITDETSGAYELLSYLDWEHIPVFKGGINADVTFRGFFLDAHIAGGGSEYSGIVHDSDYINVEEYPLLASSHSIKTHYSESQSSVDTSLDVNTRLGYAFEIADFLSLAPYARFAYNYMFYKATGGSYWYNTDNSAGYYGSYTEATEDSLSGIVLTLQRQISSAWVGGQAAFAIGDRVKITAEGAVCVFAQILSLDHHCATRTYYLDEMQGWFCGWNAAADGTFGITRNFFISVGGAYTKIFTLVGTDKSYSSTNGKAPSSQNVFSLEDGYLAGADCSDCTVYISGQIKL